jgi:uncharacterized membrane protein/protein-disulfide isomerase
MSKYGRPLLLLLAAVAFAASVASLYVHYQLIKNPDYQSFCDVSETVSCEAVYKSAYGTVDGIPVAAGGVVWSGLVLLLTAYGMRAPRSESASRAAGYTFVLSVVGLASVFYFAYASFFVLQKACPLCMAVYVSVVGIFIVSSSLTPALGTLLADMGGDVRGLLGSPSAMGLGALWLVGSLALVLLFPREAILEAGGATPAPPPVVPMETLDQAQLDEWHRWIDAQPKVPEVVALTPPGVKVYVVKFNDYQCPACRMTYFAYKDLFAKYETSNPQDFRYETRDFPLNTKCGVGMAHAFACEAAVAVRLARAKDPAKGKELENWLFERQDSFSLPLIKQGLSEIAQVNSFDADYPKTIEAVRADVKLGQAVGVNGTPTFFVNGIRVNSLRPSYLNAAIAYLLTKT